MTSFYSISTTDFRPISFGSVYLYGEYNKIKNFLISNTKDNLLKVLAVPSYNNNVIEWSASSSLDIQKLEECSKVKQDKILKEYNDFLQTFNSFVNSLLSSKNQDNKNWGELLNSLIEGSANELFYDGENIFITWGWRLLDENSKKLIPIYNPLPSIVEDDSHVIKEEIHEDEPIPVIEPYEEIDYEEEEKLSWLDKFYLFLKKLWWLIPLLSVIILIMLLFRSCENQACIDLNSKINNVDSLLDNCDCKAVQGCMDPRYKEYSPNVNVDDGSCRTKLIPCNTDTKSGGNGVTKTIHSLGKNSGTVTISYHMAGVPDKLEVFYENKRVCSTFDVSDNQDGFVGGQNSAGCCNKISFYYPATGDSFCTVIVTGGNGTSWQYTLGCPKK